MQTLFRLEDDSNVGIVSAPEWNYVRSGLQKNLNTVVQYYQRFPSRVDGSSLIQKILYSIGIPRDLPIDRFYAAVNSRALNAAMALGFTTSISKGQIFYDNFYGGKCPEVIIGHTTGFDFYQAQRNWEQLQPITILRHPKSDLAMHIPDGGVTSSEEGLAVIAVNIPMLAIQYREWRLREDAMALAAGENPRPVGNYIYSYPLTNAVYSHVDVALFNRLYNRLHGYPNGVTQRRHSFATVDFTRRLDDIQDLLLGILSRNHRQFDGVLKTVPMVSTPDLSRLAELPDTVPTRQVLWGLSAARIKMLSFMFQAQGDEARLRNASEVNRVIRNLEMWNTQQAWMNSMPVGAYMECKYDFDIVMRSR